MATIRCQYIGAEVLGLQVNKSEVEQVPSDDHQMPAGGGGGWIGPQVWFDVGGGVYGVLASYSL